MDNKTIPAYLYDPERCPCPRGEAAGCQNYKKCGLCTASHHARDSYCACEKEAMSEGFTYEELIAYLKTIEFA